MAMTDPPPNLEGFICPVCHWMGKDGIELADHFEREHEESPSSHKSRLQALSHQNLAVGTFTPPSFGHQPNCRICRVAFGYSKTRHHCRNCGNSCCGPHSRNSMALPHFSYPAPVRVCDLCFDSITQERQGTTSTNSQGVVMSGKLLKGDVGNIEVLVRLTHLSMTLFNIESDGYEDNAGKLIQTLHLSDIISIRHGGFSTCDFVIGDTLGNSLTLRAKDELLATHWVEIIMLTKNELLDAVRHLHNNDSYSPHVQLVYVKDTTTIGVYDTIAAQDVSMKKSIQLPYITSEDSTKIEILLNIGKLTINGNELYNPSLIPQRHDNTESGDEDEDEDDERVGSIKKLKSDKVWIRAIKSNGNSKQLLIQLKITAQNESFPLGTIQFLSFVLWLKSRIFIPNTERTNLPFLVKIFNFFITNPFLSKSYVVFSMSIGLFSMALFRVTMSTETSFLEFLLLTGTASFISLLALVLMLRGHVIKTHVKCFTIELLDFSWIKEESSLNKKNGEKLELSSNSESSTNSKSIENVDENEDMNILKVKGTPERFVRMVRGDEALAKQFWEQTKQWRLQVQPEKMLLTSQPHYNNIKESITHYLHKRDRQGRLVYYEVLDGPRNAFKTLKERGCSLDDIVNHMMFCNEFCYKNLVKDYDNETVKPKPTGQLIKIMDIKSLGLGDVGGDVSAYFNKVGLMGKNYPERIDKILIINVPAAFGMIWNIVAPMLDRNVRERISIFRSNYQDALFELIDPENVPIQYGGKCTCGGQSCRYHSPQELEMASLVEQLARSSSL